MFSLDLKDKQLLWWIMKLFCEIFKILCSAIIGSVVAMILFLNGMIFLKHDITLDTQISYADMASINLTVATIVLAAVALIVAVGAIFGYQAIRIGSIEASIEKSVLAAETQVKNELPKLLKLKLPELLKTELPPKLKEQLRIQLKEQLVEMRKNGVFQQEFARAVYGSDQSDDTSDEERIKGNRL